MFGGTEGWTALCSTPNPLEHCCLDIFVEPNLIEVFINDGEYVIRRFLFNRGISPNDPIRRMISLALMDDAKFVFLFVEIADRASL